jgi:hypothetical protein
MYTKHRKIKMIFTICSDIDRAHGMILHPFECSGQIFQFYNCIGRIFVVIRNLRAGKGLK